MFVFYKNRPLTTFCRESDKIQISEQMFLNSL